MSQVDGIRYGAYPLALLGGRAQKRKNGLCQHFCPGESCPPALALMPDNSAPPHVSLTFFNLLPTHWSSEAVNLSKSVHGPFKRNSLGFQKFLSSTASIPTGFYSQMLWGFIFLALEPRAGGLVWCWDSLLLSYPSWFLSATCGCGTSLLRVFNPPTSFAVVSF